AREDDGENGEEEPKRCRFSCILHYLIVIVESGRKKIIRES
ncbi:hypothetical protein ZOSMA_8841G00010, partial [Zostera marina]